MTQTEPSTLALAVPSGTDLYDALMGAIEPDLVTVRLPLLTQKYKSETTEEHAARMDRYRKAYEEYDRQAEEWMMNFRVLVTACRKEALTTAEKKDKNAESTLLSNIESQLSTRS